MKRKLYPLVCCLFLAAFPAVATETPARRPPETAVSVKVQAEARENAPDEKSEKAAAAQASTEQSGKADNAPPESRNNSRLRDLPYGAGYEARRGGGQRRGGGRGR